MNVSPKLSLAFAIPSLRLEVRQLLRLMGHIGEMEKTGEINTVAKAYSQESICEFTDIADSLKKTYGLMQNVHCELGNIFGAEMFVLKCELEAACQAVDEFCERCKQKGSPS